MRIQCCNLSSGGSADATAFRAGLGDCLAWGRAAARRGLFLLAICAPLAARGAEGPAAKVDGAEISVAQVNAAVAAAAQGRSVPLAELPKLQAEALAQLVDRRLVEAHLADRRAKPEQVAELLATIKAQLAAQKTTWEKFLQQRGLTPQQFEEQLAWQITWERYAAERLSDEALRKFFAARQEEFDGTERRVAHILLRPDKAGETPQSPRLLERAAKLREAIEAGQLTFVDAAKKYSAGPSRHRDGDVGLLPRRGVMAEPFAKAAFALEPGELSQPVVTRFGVHLLKVTEVKRGSRTYEQVRDQLRAPAAQALFDELAERLRGPAKIEFSGALPYYKPGTKDLVLPATAAK